MSARLTAAAAVAQWCLNAGVDHAAVIARSQGGAEMRRTRSEIAAHLYASGYTHAEIAIALRRDRSTVSYWLSAVSREAAKRKRQERLDQAIASATESLAAQRDVTRDSIRSVLRRHFTFFG